jgi:adenylate cyclase
MTEGVADAAGEPPDDLTPVDLRALVESAGALSAELELNGLLYRILDQACLLTDSPSASVLLPLSAEDLYFAAARGPNAEAVLDRWGINSGRGVPISGSKAGEVFCSGQPIVEHGVTGDVDHFEQVDLDVHHTTTSMVCVPLYAAGSRLGVMQLLNKRTGRYARRDLALLQHFSTQAAIAIRNVQLFDDLLAHMGLYGSRGRGVGPAELLQELNAPAHYEQVTILFADMRHFTQLSQVTDRPEQTFKYVDEFLGLLTTTVLTHKGLVNKFLGDGLMAMFRHGNHSKRAVACAFEIVDQFDQLKAAWHVESNTFLDFLDVGIGMATDSVLLGSVGTDRVRDFTAIGTSVSLAAHLTYEARDGDQILVDKRTFLLAQELIPHFEGPRRVDLRSRGQDVGRRYDCYSITSRRSGESKPSTTLFPNYEGARAADLRSDAGGTAETPSRNANSSPDVFISYCHRDKPWLIQLQDHLKPVVQYDAVKVWDDTLIEPGQKWRSEIQRVLANAKVAVLLVTPAFLASDFITRNELPPLLDAACQTGLKVLWIPVKPSSVEKTPIAEYQAVLNPKKPLIGLQEHDRDAAFVTIAEKISTVLRDQAS